MNVATRSMLDEALRLRRFGLSVIPLHAPGTRLPSGVEDSNAGKMPLIPWREFQERLPAEDEIIAWWTRWPEANIGVVTGQVSGVIVLDVDGPEGQESLKRFAPVPVTWRSSTARGEHFWSRHIGDTVRNFAKRLPGLDFRGDGGYVVAPPSLHRTGRRYEWVISPESADLADPPAWLLDLIEQPVQADNGQRGGEIHNWLKRLQGAEKGHRHAVATQIAGHFLGLGRTPEEVEALLLGFAAQCSPPHDSEDTRRIVRDLAAKDAAKTKTRVQQEPWPVLAPEALYGLAGEIVAAIDPYTEADPVATLAHFLVAVGNVVGPGPHARVQHDRHPVRLNVALVGPTAKGRKGLAWVTPRYILAQVDEGWARHRVKSGLSSGEGLIYHVRDPREESQPVKEKGRVVGREQVLVDEGEPDKRLLILEPELAVVLKRMAGEGNSLSGVIREAWDSGNLSTLTKNSPLRATGAHVSIICHVTSEELQRYLTETERANGFANRFLWILVRRSKMLPEGGAVPDEKLFSLIEELRRVVVFARGVGEVQRDDKAREIWATVYPELSEGKPALFGAITSRAEAQALRLSTLYALLDGSDAIRPPHLLAALAFWQYAEQSARLIFGDSTGNPVADRILRTLRTRGEMTGTAVRDLFHRNVPGGVIDSALDLLARTGLARSQARPTDGRPVTVWACTT